MAAARPALSSRAPRAGAARGTTAGSTRGRVSHRFNPHGRARPRAVGWCAGGALRVPGRALGGPGDAPAVGKMQIWAGSPSRAFAAGAGGDVPGRECLHKGLQELLWGWGSGWQQESSLPWGLVLPGEGRGGREAALESLQHSEMLSG